MAQSADEENPYWISFSDIMAGLLVIFILAVLTLILELTETRSQISKALEELVKAEGVRRTILEEIHDELEQKGIKVEISENHTVLRVSEKLLGFENNQYAIPPDAKVQETVLQIGKVLQASIVKDERWKYLDTVFVEGHTDDNPTKRVMGNWGLSTFRAISVWNYWEENLEEGERLSKINNHGEEEKLFSVSGYGDTRPVQVEQLTELQHRKNRRIDLRFTIKRPAREDFEALKDLGM